MGVLAVDCCHWQRSHPPVFYVISQASTTLYLSSAAAYRVVQTCWQAVVTHQNELCMLRWWIGRNRAAADRSAQLGKFANWVEPHWLERMGRLVVKAARRKQRCPVKVYKLNGQFNERIKKTTSPTTTKWCKRLRKILLTNHCYYHHPITQIIQTENLNWFNHCLRGDWKDSQKSWRANGRLRFQFS